MFMPLASRLLYTLVGAIIAIGSFAADYNETHIFNPNWPPHAKFHGGQTLSMSVLLGLMTTVFAWRKASDRTTAVITTAAFAALYWISQLPRSFIPVLRSLIRSSSLRTAIRSGLRSRFISKPGVLR